MRKRKILGYYVVNAAGEQMAWHKLRSLAARAAKQLRRHEPTVIVVPEYEEAA